MAVVDWGVGVGAVVEGGAGWRAGAAAVAVVAAGQTVHGVPLLQLVVVRVLQL